jgi:hypothetical protein
MPDYEGYDRLDDFIGAADQNGIHQIVVSATASTEARRAGSHSFVAQPVVRFRLTIYLPEPSPDDPLATREVTWEVTEDSGRHDRSRLDRIVKALLSRGFAVELDRSVAA